MSRSSGQRGALVALAVLATACAPLPPPIASLDDLRGPWREMPYTLDPAVTEDALRRCSIAFPDLGLQTTAVVDGRGGGLLHGLFIGRGGELTECPNLVVSADGGLGLREGGVVRPAPDLSDAGDIAVISSRSGRDTWAEGSFVFGRAGESVASVVVESAGKRIVATLSDGWFAASWPGAGTGLITAFDADGNTTKILDFKGEPFFP